MTLTTVLQTRDTMLDSPPLLLLLLLFASPSGAQPPNPEQHKEVLISSSGQPFPWNHMRLPKTVSPLHYDLGIHPNLTTLDFTGVVRIQLQVHEDTGVIVLHAKQMQITEALLLAPEGVRPLRVLEYPPFHQLALLSDTLLTRGRTYEVLLGFAATLSDSFHGFYRSSYHTSSGAVRVLASTQFEATFARAAFPCFDEPAFKAKFTIRIIREPRHIAVSNMPTVKTVALPGGLLEDHFDTTVKMSTYLVAYIVSDFLSVSRTTQRGVKISVYAVPEKIDQTAFALDTAVRLLDFYEDYFDIPYPLPKQDLAAIPDFQSGAMENWGLTTYRETALLYDPDKSSPSDKLAITKVIAHELAHQWFGNLVTMEWWNDLWLNEGFAKFMEFISVNVTNPELHVDDFFLGKCFEAMEVDSLPSSHPVSTHVENPMQIQEIFDDVSYDKGACILNMLRDFVTPEAFEIGIIRYLRRFSYQNTVSRHLWESLTDVSAHVHTRGRACIFWTKETGNIRNSLDVQAIMDTWTLQEGFPLVTVEVRGREVRLSQERYLKTDEPSLTDGFLWQIPLTYVTSASSTIRRFLLKTKTDVLYLPQEVDWVKFNVDMSGYYMVHYEGDGWNAIINLLQHNHTVLTSNDRASLVHDVFQLVSLPVDVTMAVFTVGARTPEGWDFLFERYRTSLQMSVKSRMKVAMAFSPLQGKLTRWVRLRGEVMKLQDLPDVLVTISRNPHGYKLAWDFLRANWHTLIKKFDLGTSLVAYMVNGVTNQYSTTEMLDEVKLFFGSLTEETGSEMRCIQQTYETIGDNIRWMDAHLPHLQAWLDKRSSHTVHEDL
uniref:Aminopeptidase n=1 Tax=Takifugu rubripes TaxID=31033 RepID=A0A674MRJ6_TAKRU